MALQALVFLFPEFPVQSLPETMVGPSDPRVIGVSNQYSSREAILLGS